MRLVALLVALAQGTQPPDDAFRARWEVANASFEVGEPFAGTLVVEHPAGATVQIDISALESDLGWLVARAPSLEATDVQAGGGSAGDVVTERWTCSLASLEPGTRALPPLSIALIDREGKRTTTEVGGAEVEISGALGAGEDAPREPKDFRPAGPELAALDARWIAGLGLAALLALGALVVWIRARRRSPAVREPDALERLGRIAARDLDDAEVVRELHYELTSIVRAHFDALDGTSRHAMTDEEWVASASASHAAQGDDLRDLMRAADAVKYGSQRPTRWAVTEQIERAKRLVQAAGTPAKAAA